MIFMPPRHGKSELASRKFPAWYLGRNPHKNIIAASYNDDLAQEFGGDVRNLMKDQAYGRLFDTRLSADSTAKDRWRSADGGGYLAAGVGTATTGFGAHVFLIDDPVKDRVEADSEVTRRKIKNWYTSTVYTRLEDGGAIVIIMTRWNEDDLAGWLLEEAKHGGDQWDVLELQAINERNEALWPEKYDLAALERIKAALSRNGPRDWSALYQQRPVPDEGVFFLRDWIRWYDEPPPGLQIYGASDYAVTEGGGDYTVHLVAGVNEHDDLYLLDRWRAQTTPDVWVEAFIGLLLKWRPLQWAEENGQILKAVGSLIDRRQQESGAWCYRKQYASTADKPTRAQAIRGRMAAGRVYLPRNAPWVGEFIAELLSFPAGKNDDQIDPFSLLGRMLGEMISGSVPKVERDDPVTLGPVRIADMAQRHFQARARMR